MVKEKSHEGQERKKIRKEKLAMVPRRISGGNIDRLGFGCGVTLE